MDIYNLLRRVVWFVASFHEGMFFFAFWLDLMLGTKYKFSLSFVIISLISSVRTLLDMDNVSHPRRVVLRHASALLWRARAMWWRVRLSLMGHKIGAGAPQLVTAPHQLMTVAPLLLHTHLAAPDDRLALWRTSRSLALLVWQHTPRARLSLTGSYSLGSLSHRLRRPRETALANLLARGSPSFTPPDSHLERITALTLTSVKLSVDGLRTLPQLPHLHALTLQGCNLAASTTTSTSTTTATTTTGPNPLFSGVRSLACTDCEDTPLTTALSLVDPGCLQALTTDDAEVHHLMWSFTALQRLSRPAGEVTDDESARILAHPLLREVCVRRLALKNDYRNKECNWQELRVLESATAASIAALPLQGVAVSGGIERCVVQQGIHLGSPSDITPAETVQQLGALLEVVSLVFQPAVAHSDWGLIAPNDSTRGQQERLGLGVDELAFNLVARYHGAEATPQALQLVAARLVGSCTLVLSLCVATDPEVLRSLGGLPPAVTSVVFWGCEVPEDRRSVFLHLPQHVGRFVVKRYGSAPTLVYHRGNIISGGN